MRTVYEINTSKLTILKNGKLEYQARSNQELDHIVKMMLLGKNDTIKFNI